MNRNIRQTIFPLLAALIWGTAFAAQSMVTDRSMNERRTRAVRLSL